MGVVSLPSRLNQAKVGWVEMVRPALSGANKIRAGMAAFWETLGWGALGWGALGGAAVLHPREPAERPRVFGGGSSVIGGRLFAIA